MTLRDELLSDARTEINAVLQMKDRISLDRMKEMVADYDEKMGANLRAERNALQVLVAEAEQIAAELQALHESDDFRAVAAAVDKFAGTPIQRKVAEVQKQWDKLQELKDSMLNDVRTRMLAAVESGAQPSELLALIKDASDKFGGELLSAEIKRLEAAVSESHSHALHMAECILQRDNEEENDDKTLLIKIEEVMLLANEHHDLADVVEDLREEFGAIVIAAIEKAELVSRERSTFIEMLRLLHNAVQLVDLLSVPGSAILGAFVEEKAALGANNSISFVLVCPVPLRTFAISVQPRKCICEPRH
eukprot:SAG31_NODE_327_length_17650_cov_18.626574_7_plen_306_part_00